MKLFHSSRALRVALPCLLLGLSRAGYAETLVSIDVPSATSTAVYRVNALGEMIGGYFGSTGFHAFARFPGGAFVTIDVPTDLTDPITSLNSINWAGQIVGTVSGTSMGQFVMHGFVRDPFGRITLLDVPGASETAATANNAEGWVAGSYRMSLDNTEHGFLHRPGRPLVTFDFPGPSGGNAIAIDATGRIFGIWVDERGTYRAYVRTLDGVFTTTDPPDLATAPIVCPRCSTGTLPSGSNALGRSVGIYSGTTAAHGYLRTAGGTFVDIDVPGAFRTSPAAINLQGQIAGTYSGGDSFPHGFVMQPDGSFRSFEVFGASVIGVTDINVRTEVVGYYDDANSRRHGFLYRM